MKIISMLCDIFHQTSKRMPMLLMYICFFIDAHLFFLSLFELYDLIRFWYFFPSTKRLCFTIGMVLFALVSCFFIAVEVATRDSRMENDEDEDDLDDWYDPWNI